MVGNSSSSNCSSGKLFTWGDGDTYRLGHGDMESKLVPTCVAALVDPNVCQVTCGHSMTVALTASGHVYTMGSQIYGQLVNPQTDGKIPIRVGGKLSKGFVEEIACGANHVAVLTSKTEVYTWGRGANGQLGHGDIDNRNSPTLVEGLKDKQVKSIACGTNFTAVVCLHKWVSGTDQSMCSGCRQPFNFKRKRHNCYNCGLVFCHSCSSKKSLKASMALNPNKPYRVCDNCANKLKKTINADVSSLVSIIGSVNTELNNKDDKLEPSFHPLSSFSSMESLKPTENRSSKHNKKLEFSSSHVSPLPKGNGSSQWGGFNISKSLNPVFESSKKFFSASVPASRIVSRATYPISRRSSPLRSTTPIPTLGGLSSPKIVIDDANKTNDDISQEVLKLTLVENLTRKVQLQEIELERTSKKWKEAIAIAEEESSKCKVAKEVIKSLTSQLKDMAERLPVGAARSIKSPSLTTNGVLLNAAVDQLNGQTTVPCVEESHSNGLNSLLKPSAVNSGINRPGQLEVAAARYRSNNGESQRDGEWVEQNEPGVYITLRSLPGGATDLKQVRFSQKRFSDQQAEQWWIEIRKRVYEQYNVQILNKSERRHPKSTT